MLPSLPPLPHSGDEAGLKDGVYHYAPDEHLLEKRAGLNDEAREALDGFLGGSGFLIGLSSIYWREAWKYGERAFRYCNLDVGHAVAALRFSAALLGWRLKILDELSGREIDTILGFDKTSWKELEAEEAELICLVHNSEQKELSPPVGLAAAFEGLSFTGVPEALGRDPVRWDAIYTASERTEKPGTEAEPSGIERTYVEAGAAEAASPRRPRRSP